ncbi:thioredoxin family protein [Dyadobacter helix]|nr:thioredoxin family protein [Dyadobacter sp. CECT 9275]
MKIYLWLSILFISTGLTVTDHSGSSGILGDQITPGYQIGDAVSNFSLKSTKGGNVSLNDFLSAKGLIVVFTSNHCPFSKAYEDRLLGLSNKFESQGFRVIAINPSDPGIHQDDSFEKMKERANTKAFNFTYLADDNQQVAKAFGAARTPQAFVLQKNGTKFILRYTGMIDDNPQDPQGVKKFYVDEAVGNLLEGKPVVTTVTKPMGCPIKWKN